MAQMSSTPRPDFPNEAANRAGVHASKVLNVCREYFDSPDSPGSSRDWSGELERLEALQSELASACSAASKLGYQDSVPEPVLQTLKHAEEFAVRVRDMTGIEDVGAPLSGPLADLRSSIEKASDAPHG